MPATIVDYIQYLEWISEIKTTVTILSQDEFDIYMSFLNALKD